MKVAKWGNSLAVRLPAEVIETLGLKEGDEIDLRTDLENTVSLEVLKQLKKADAIRDLRKLRGTLPDDFKFDRNESNER